MTFFDLAWGWSSAAAGGDRPRRCRDEHVVAWIETALPPPLGDNQEAASVAWRARREDFSATPGLRRTRCPRCACLPIRFLMGGWVFCQTWESLTGVFDDSTTTSLHARLTEPSSPGERLHQRVGRKVDHASTRWYWRKQGTGSQEGHHRACPPGYRTRGFTAAEFRGVLKGWITRTCTELGAAAIACSARMARFGAAGGDELLEESRPRARAVLGFR